MTKTDTPMDWTTMEDLSLWLDDQEEPRCEADHEKVGLTCSGSVVARVIVPCTAQHSALVCKSVAEYTRRAISTANVCSTCGQPIKAHWRVIPV